jgi:signal transduction histidine kinase
MPIQGLLVLLRDTTALRRLQQLASHQDRLKALGELAAHLAHEIRNPLGGIKGFATLLKQELVERSDLQTMAASIVEGADDLNCFVSNVLQYVRPFHVNLEQVDVMVLIEDVKHLMEMDSAWDGTVEFSVESAVSSFVLSIDPHYFRSALLNLFVNAVQAMPEGGTLTIRVEDEEFWGVVTVEDTGEGITAENMSKLFTPFFTTKEAGNGLGLAEVHKVMQEHQGTIEVQSELGVGTKFILKVRK